MPAAFDPVGQDLSAIGAALQEGLITSVQLVDFYLARIAAYDKAGPRINAMISLNPAARADAARLDDERARGESRGPLHGLPMAVKDNIDVAGLPTTAGSAVLRDHMPARDAAVVQRLRAAGAIVLGKANMSEFACSNGRHGYSSLGGLTLNPYNRARNAAGSSSGSAAAVAADFAAFALGSDTFGSVRAPSCVTGLAGLRPTQGLVDAEGVLPLAASFDTVGPMARSVRDVALVLQALVQPAQGRADEHRANQERADQGPGAGRCIAGNRLSETGAIDYLGGMRADALRGARIGIALDFPGQDAEVRGIAAAAWRRMSSLGASLEPVWLPAPAATVHAAFLGSLADAELEAGWREYMARTPGAWPATLEQLVRAVGDPLLAHSPQPVNPLTVQGLRRFHTLAREQTAGQRAELRAQAEAFQGALEGMLRNDGLDAIVYPTLSCPAWPRHDRDDPAYLRSPGNPYVALYAASAAGLPDVTVRAGMARAGVPVGISFLGMRRSEGRLLALAHAFEQAGGARPRPVLPAIAT